MNILAWVMAVQQEGKARWRTPAVIGAAALATIYGAGALLAALNGARLSALLKPAMQPPGVVFYIAWAAVYCAAAASFAVALKTLGAKGHARLWALYMANGALNALWPVISFALGSFTGGMFVLAAMLTFCALLLKALHKRARRTPALLLTPYAAWLAYAAVLNYMVVMLN